ncbi:hypothetical protein BUALT_Bualt11G0053300 [Buddleja alternifolia]|uniref:SWIM-type domain-containing protein n=1 Tax=Buddleja alternifolia TaxID=168488 RepID=A0AAV6WU25_9LAMI|nr:hypothetical protein BUALT_Bualt11G0053300 [Buddleja alternifolia]
MLKSRFSPSSLELFCRSTARSPRTVTPSPPSTSIFFAIEFLMDSKAGTESNQEMNCVDMNEDDDRGGTSNAAKVSSIIDQLESRLALGQIVSDIDEAYSLYKTYALAKGFSVRKSKNRYFEKTKEVRLKVFLCNKEGEKNVENKRGNRVKSETKTGCKARLEVARERNSEWKVKQFHIEHNHELALPDEIHLLKSARDVTTGVVGVLKNIVNSGIASCDGLNFTEEECGGEENIGLNVKDAFNLINVLKNSKIDSSDCSGLFQHFQNRISENECFFWDAEFNELGLLKTFFWRDNRCGIDYDYFGDVVSFDSTYRINKYNLICAPFVGINHHGHNVMFGCAFLSDETITTFEWLFRTFLRAMGNKYPQTIFTNQCQAMMTAVENVFPNTRHRLCQWHIKKDAPSHLGSLNNNFQFKSAFKKCMEGCESEEDFEESWKEMMNNHGCHNNKWLNDMYEIRQKWSTAFMGDEFNGGLKSTCRSENGSHVLKELGEKATSPYNFVIAFEGLVRNWRTKEKNEDFNCKQGKLTRVVKHNPLLIQAGNVYTNTIYKEFEQELMNGTMANSRSGKISCGGTSWMYEVISHETNRVKNLVFDTSTMEVKCSCKKFESVGVLCSHALLIFTTENVHKIPERYIISRWTTNVKNRIHMVESDEAKNGNDIEMVYSNQILRFTQELIARSKSHVETREILSRCLEDAASKIDNFVGRLRNVTEVIDINTETAITDHPVESRRVSNFLLSSNKRKPPDTEDSSRRSKKNAREIFQSCQQQVSSTVLAQSHRGIREGHSGIFLVRTLDFKLFVRCISGKVKNIQILLLSRFGSLGSRLAVNFVYARVTMNTEHFTHAIFAVIYCIAASLPHILDSTVKEIIGWNREYSLTSLWKSKKKLVSMFSLSYITPCIFLYQTQPPYLIDAKKSNLPKYKKHCSKAKGYSNASKSDSLSVPSYSEDLPFPTNSHFLYPSHANAHNSNNVLVYDVKPINRPVDSTALGHLLQSCSNVEEIRRAHAVVVKRMKDPIVFVNNNLISVYVKFGDLVAARGVFDNMLEKNVVSWTAMLNGYQKYDISNEALGLFREFVNSGVRGNAQTYVCMLNLCGRISDYELGKQLHACIIKSQVSNLILDCTILHFYARCGDLDSAFQVFDRVEKRDLIAWTTMITACSQHGRGHEAFVMLSHMLSHELDPNEFTICSVLNACGEERELGLGKQLHGTVVKKAYDRDVYVGTSLVDMYAKCGKIDDSRTLFDGIKWRNAITWNAIIAGYAHNGLGEEAIKLFRVMKRVKLYTNNLTMVSILRACGLLRALSTGKEVHAQILKNFAPCNICIGSALVWLYCKCGEYGFASRVLKYLPDKDVVSWTAMISGCAHLGHEHEALEYLKEMLGEGVEPNPFTYSSALKACAKLENIKQGKLIHSSINKTPALANVFVGSALVHMYSKCGHLSEALQVFDSMPERNLVSWKAMIVAYARNGFCSEALKLMYRMQAEGIQVDDYILSTVLTACGYFNWDEKSSRKHCLQS